MISKVLYYFCFKLSLHLQCRCVFVFIFEVNILLAESAVLILVAQIAVQQTWNDLLLLAKVDDVGTR